MTAKRGGKGSTAAKPKRPDPAAAKPKPGKVTAKPKAKVLTGEVLPSIEAKPPGKRGPAKGTPRAPDHVPDDRSRQVVEAMSSYGIPQDAIAPLVGPLGISVPTLEKHYRRELDTARTKLSAKLTESLVAQALGHPALYDEQGRKIRDEQRRYAPAAMWLLRREDFIEAKRLEAEAAAQEAARYAIRDRLKIAFEFSSPEEIEVLERVFGRVAERLAQGAG